jgi:hypothetical protein
MPIAAGSPDGADDHGVRIEGVVDVTIDPSKIEPTQPGKTGTRVRRARSGEERKHADGILELSCDPPLRTGISTVRHDA